MPMIRKNMAAVRALSGNTPSLEQNGSEDVSGSLAFGRRLSKWRKSRRMPLKQVAAGLGVSVQVVSDWERGRRFPSSRHLALIENFTNVPLCTFFRGENHPCPYADPSV
jgi:DNA-binding transcriptional regulator YiaG